MRASKFIEAHSIKIRESVSASKKLHAADAKAIARESKTMVVMKGKKITHFKVGDETTEEAVTAMLGNTGNMRAPLIRAGNLVLVGFNEEIYGEHFG